MKLTFIGGGNMGTAILSSILGKNLAMAQDITVSDVSEGRRKELNDKFGVHTVADNTVAVRGSDIIVMAIKPQTLPKILPELKGKLQPEQLIISIIAGTPVRKLREGLDHDCIVRAMPNTPAQIGEGMTVWTATGSVSPAQQKIAKTILAVMGKEIYAADEDYIDMATAVSGSGPAYVFLFMEALLASAETIGLPSDVAKQLVLQTVIGSARYAELSDKSLSELRVMVTSPGGTTAEALKKFEQGEFNNLVSAAVRAAFDKAKILGR